MTAAFPRRAALVALAALLSGGALAGCGSGGGPSSSTPPGARSTTATAAVGVTAGGPHVRVPPDFLGLSFEASDVGLLVRAADRGNLVALLRLVGHGVLRIGGTSADTETAWVPAGGVRPSWATATITPADLAGLARLATASGWSVLLTVNLGHYDPAAAAAEVRTARAALGSRLLGIAIANEPERFVGHHLRGLPWNSVAYRGQIDAYRAAIERSVPGLALAGPDAVSLAGSLGWVQREATWENPALLTAHYYPLGRCGSYVPSIGDLLSDTVRRAETQMLTLAVAVERRTGLPLRLDETNNVACGGQPGVSDTFAAALWATDYLGRAMATDIRGINLHGLLTRPTGYAPLAFDSAAAARAGRLSVKPEFYALLLARHLVGDRALGESLTPPALQGSVRAYRRPDGGVDVLAVNEAAPGTAPVLVRVPLPSRLGTTIEWRLTAPGPSATTGVRLAGRLVAANGSFSGAPARPASTRGPALRVRLAADSALLVELRSTA